MQAAPDETLNMQYVAMLHTHSCCQAGRQEQVTGLEYHTAEPPPASAATQCMHWVSSPQVSAFPDILHAFQLAAETSLACWQLV